VIQQLDQWASYLPPQAIIGQMFITAMIAFGVVQFIKQWRRDTGRRRLLTSEKIGLTVVISLVLLAPALIWLHELVLSQAAVYTIEGALFSPTLITIAMALLDRFAPEVRRALKQDRRSGKQPSIVGSDRRQLNPRDQPKHDDTTGYL